MPVQLARGALEVAGFRGQLFRQGAQQQAYGMSSRLAGPVLEQRLHGLLGGLLCREASPLVVAQLPGAVSVLQVSLGLSKPVRRAARHAARYLSATAATTIWGPRRIFSPHPAYA